MREGLTRISGTAVVEREEVYRPGPIISCLQRLTAPVIHAKAEGCGRDEAA